MAQGQRRILQFWGFIEKEIDKAIDRRSAASQVTLPEGVTAELNVLASITQAEPRKAKRRYIAGRRG